MDVASAWPRENSRRTSARPSATAHPDELRFQAQTAQRASAPGTDDAGGSARTTGRPSGRSKESARDRPRPAPGARGPGLRGAVAVLGMFLLTLAGAGAESLLSVGLGIITLVALAGSSAVAAFLVRRRDLLSVVIAPPLVFTAVAAVNIALAPSVTFSLPTVATLLIRGFPAMALATAVALLLGLFRLIARR